MSENPSKERKTERELIPSGITYNRGSRSLPAPSFPGVEYGTQHTSTFGVVPNHTRLEGVAGVRFNVETVPEALEKHLKKPMLTREELVRSLRKEAASYYIEERRGDASRKDRRRPNEAAIAAQDVKIEAASEPRTEDIHLISTGSNGFAMACVMAFAQHLPLELSPDHIWVLISYAFAKHVDKNAEALRANFVQHEGKKRLLVETPSSFRMSSGNNPDTGASAAEWESVVFPKFSRQIKEYVGDTTHAAIASDFSTTTPAARAANQICLMSAMQNYFSYGMRTKCGIPDITLLGTEQDWVALRARAEHLGSLMMPEFSTYWMPLLLPILDEFVESYKGNVNHGFWQSMVKLRHTGAGSGSHSFISGWMQILFPYLGSGRLNKKLHPWQEMYFAGPQLSSFPLISSLAPVDWDYHGRTVDLNFHAGVLGCSQRPSTGALSPVLGWYVSHVPPKTPEQELKDVKAEISALLLGHKQEAEADDVDKDQPWFQRVSYLQKRAADLERQVLKRRFGL